MPALKWAKKASISLSLAILLAIVHSQPTNNSTLAATYSQGTLRVTIPYQAARSGAGQLTLDILDPEDRAVASAQKRAVVSAGGEWREELKLSKPLATDDLIWHRLRYRFTYSDPKQKPIEGTESISRILRMPVVRVFGEQSYIAGGPAAVRVIVNDSAGQPVAGPSTVAIALSDPGQPARDLFSGPLNQHGTTEAQFTMPSGVVGAHTLHYEVDTPIGSAELAQAVQLADQSQILLTTEKPLYQPGQTIHARALALDRGTHEASASRPLTLELQDSRGNKIFKKATRTDEFGVASAEFQLADEVNLGNYQLRATLAGVAPTTELTLDVERYVLPKFKVALELSAAQHGYRPGDHVIGTVRANYFFGKSIDGGDVTVRASAMDVQVVQAASTAGKTDRDGAWRFDLTLPNYFAGRPVSQGAARVLIEATVKDTAGHSESRSEPVIVSESPILITAVPEGGTLIPYLENQVFLLTSYADGLPAATELTIHQAAGKDQTATTDAGGVAIVRITPGQATENLHVEAHDQSGNSSTKARPPAIKATSFASPPTSRGRWKTPATRAPRSQKRAPTSSRTWTAPWTHTRSRCWPISPPITPTTLPSQPALSIF